MDTAILQETRNLLNSLNEENAELKAHAEHLTQQWRQAVNELELERQRFAQLEHDSKQINSNLIKQLQTLQAQDKSSQSAQGILERRAHSMELQLERLAEAKASAEDRVAALEKSLGEAISREERERREKLDARAEADRATAELQRTLSTEREKTVASERSLATRCDELALELQRQQDLVASAKKQSESQRRESDRIVERLQGQLDAANEAASRTRHAEAECTFAHEEIHAVAEHYYETLSDLQARSRATEIESAEVSNALNKITDKFRAIALASAAQRKNSEALVNFYAANYTELKQLLEATVAENSEIRNSVETRVSIALGDVEKRARDAAVRQEKSHQDQLGSVIGDLEAKQRERDALAKENERLRDALHESHESEKQLRAFSEQLYADVVAANKVASEAAEKERRAKAELTTLEHRVSEQVRRELVTTFEQERSKLVTELSRVKKDYEMEITELKAQLDENAFTLQSALSRMMTKQQQQQQQQEPSRSASAARIVHQHFPQHQHQHEHRQHDPDNQHANFSSAATVVSPNTPPAKHQNRQAQQQLLRQPIGRVRRATSDAADVDAAAGRYSVEPSQSSSSAVISREQASATRSSSAPNVLLQQFQQFQPQFHGDDDHHGVDYSSTSVTRGEQHQQQYRHQSASPPLSHRYNFSSSHSPVRNAAALPRPSSVILTNNGSSRNQKRMKESQEEKKQWHQQFVEVEDNDEEEEERSPSQLRWPPKMK